MADLQRAPSQETLRVPEDEFSVYRVVYTFPGHADALEAVHAETTRLTHFESGSIYYCICRDTQDVTKYHFFERYRSRKAFDAHNAQLIIQKLLQDNYFNDVKAVFAKLIRLVLVKL